MANTAKSYVPSLSSEVSTATATSNAATLNAQLGIITTEALTTAQDGTYICTLTNSFVGTGSVVMASLFLGTSSAGTPILATVTPGAGTVVFVVYNKHASAVALNGTLKIAYVVL